MSLKAGRYWRNSKNNGDTHHHATTSRVEYLSQIIYYIVRLVHTSRSKFLIVIHLIQFYSYSSDTDRFETLDIMHNGKLAMHNDKIETLYIMRNSSMIHMLQSYIAIIRYSDHSSCTCWSTSNKIVVQLTIKRFASWHLWKLTQIYFYLNHRLSH